MSQEAEHGDAFAKGRDQQQAWKHEQVKRYAVGFVKTGIQLGYHGVPFVGSDDVPEEFLPDGVESPGIAGSAIVMLTHATIIEPYRGTDGFRNPPIISGRRRSTRSSANGRKVNVYKIVNRGLAEAFLRANGAAVEARQRELVMA